MSVFPTLKTSYKNDLDLIEKILMCYSIMQDKPLRKFEMTVLKYYIKYGYCQEAEDYIKDDENKKAGDIRVANVHLRNNGYLLHGVDNLRKSKLSSDMEKVRKSFVEEKKNLYVIHFERA